jgi:N-acetylneuraminate synthase
MNDVTFKIEDKVIGGDKVFIIAEIGNNHNGSLELAKKLVNESIKAGADCVKFQIRNSDALYRFKSNSSQSEDLGAEYIQDLLKKVELNLDAHREIREYCRENKIIYLCTPWDEPSVDAIASLDVPAYKIASADLCNPFLIKKVVDQGKPVIISTGMSYEGEILSTVKYLKKLNAKFVLLHCNSTYPAQEEDINLHYLERLKKIYPLIGYSGHERGIGISIGAVALGAKIVERHITLDRGMEGPDHLASLEPKDFKVMVDGIRSLEKGLKFSKNMNRVPSQGELLNRENLAKSIVASKPINIGDKFSADNLRIASPGRGLPPYELKNVINKSAHRIINIGDFIYKSDIEKANSSSIPRSYSFKLPWGVPVRYHDFKTYKDKINPKLYEFHLSYRDLELNPEDFVAHVDCQILVVHAPELFDHSELLDLAAENIDYRNRSIDNLRKVVEATNTIANFFPKSVKKYIVANVGGFSADSPVPLKDRDVLYKRFKSSIDEINFFDIEILPQNMAPFPWHFGGQRHQNIFMMPNEILFYAKKYNLNICLDLAHLMLTCNHFDLDFAESVTLLLPIVKHMHVSDAKGVNGEGVTMGSGDIDWISTWSQIMPNCQISFIPEVWQGHKDGGSGFWEALNYLEGIEKNL